MIILLETRILYHDYASLFIWLNIRWFGVKPSLADVSIGDFSIKYDELTDTSVISFISYIWEVKETFTKDDGNNILKW